MKLNFKTILDTVKKVPVPFLYFASMCAAILFFTSALYAGNLLLLSTGTFESGGTPPTYWNTSGTAKQGTTTSQVYAGTYSAYITTESISAQARKWIWNCVSVNPNQAYNFAGYAWNNVAGANNFLALTLSSGTSSISTGSAWNHVSQSTVTAATSASWQFLNMSTFNASGFTNMTINVGGNFTAAQTGTTYYFDNIYFGQPDAPAGLTQLDGSGNPITSMQWTTSSVIISSFTQSGSVSGSGPTDAALFRLQVTSVTTADAADWTKGLFVDYTSGLMSEGTTGYQWPTLTEPATYWWRVWTRDKYNAVTGSTSTTLGTGGVSKFGYSPPDNILPAAISDLTGLTGTLDGEVFLSWTSPGDDGATNSISGGQYDLRYSTNPIGNETDFSNVPAVYRIVQSTSYTTVNQQHTTVVTGLNPGTSYYFALKYRDENASNWATWSTGTYTNTASTAAAQDLIPNAVVTSTAVGGNTQITLTWTYPAVPAGVNDYDKFWVYRSTASFTEAERNDSNYVFVAATFTYLLGYSATSYINTGLTNLTTYYYHISLFDKGDQGQGLYSVPKESFSVVEVSTIPWESPPSAPTGFTGIAQSTYSINWSWTDNGIDETGYRVRYATSPLSTDASASTSLSSATVNFNWTEDILSANSSYCRVVVATNSAGESPLSNPATAWTLARPPTNLVFPTDSCVGYSSATFQWNVNGNPTWTRFGVAKSSNTEFYGATVSTFIAFADNFTGNTTTAFNLNADTTYWFRVWAYNEVSTMTAYIQLSTATKVGPPAAPSNLIPFAVYSSSILWQFTDNATNETGLYISSGDYTRLSENLGPLTGTGTTSWWEINLGTNTPCKRYAEATNANGSIWSTSITSYTAAVPPITPTATTNNTTSINLTWNANQNPGTTRYGLSRSTNSEFTGTAVSTFVSYTDNLTAAAATATGLSVNTTYWFKVWAYNGDQIATLPAGDVNFSTTTAPPTQTNIVISQVMLATTTTSGEFVELYNPSASPINLQTSVTKGNDTGALCLHIINTTPTDGNKIIIWKNTTIPAYGYFLIAATAVAQDVWNFSAAPDAIIYSSSTAGGNSGNTLVANGAVYISTATTLDSSLKIDLVGFGTNANYETAATTSPANGVSVERLPADATGNGTDTNNNLADFKWPVVPHPRPASFVLAPAGISDLTGLSGGAEGTIVLKWTSPGDDGTVGNLTGTFRINYSSVAIVTASNFTATSSTFATVVDISTTTLPPLTACTSTFYNLTPGTSYWFAIKTQDDVGNWSVWNSSASGLAVNTSAYACAQDLTPAAPSNFTSLAGDTQIQLSWTANSETDLNYYKIYRDTSDPYDFADGLSPGTTPYSFTTFMDTGLQNGTSHVYRMTAVDKTNHESAFSTIISTIPNAGPPFAPSGLTAVLLGPTSVQWRFTDNANNEDGLFIATGTWPSNYWENLGPITSPQTGGTTSWWQLNLSTNTQYTVKAGATNAYGASWTSAVSTYTLAVTPSNLVATTNDSTSINLTWSAGQNPGTTMFGLSRATNSTFTTGVTTFVDFSKGLTAITTAAYSLSGGTTYWFRVWAYNGAGVPTDYVVTSSATAIASANYLKIANNGFELSPSLVSWSKEGTASQMTQSSTQKRTGSYSCKFNAPTTLYNDRRILSSTSTVSAGNTYTVGAYFYVVQSAGVIGDTQIRIGIRWIDAGDSVIYISTSADNSLSAFSNWEKLTYTAVAPAGAVNAVMSISVKETTNNDNVVYVDDVDSTPDTTPPNAIPDLLAATGVNPGEVNLTWTAPGDDGNSGNNASGAYYELKYSTYSASVAGSTVTWWNNAVTYYQAWTVGTQGSGESKTLNLNPDITYWFAIRTIDAAGNVSKLDTGTTVEITVPGAQAWAVAQTGAVGSSIRINEIAPDQTSSQGYDFIEFYNPGPATPDIFGWEIFDYYTQDTYLEKVEGHWNFPANSYLVLRFNQTRSMTTPTQISPTYYELYTDKSGISQTDNVIILSTATGGTILDAVCYGDQSGTITNSTRLRAAYNVVLATNQWTGPAADGTNDATVETYWASTLYNASSGWSISRSSTSTDGTNPSYKEWAMTYSTSRGAANPSFDVAPPSAINNLAGIAGDNRGTVRLTWTAVGDDGNTGTASGYHVKYRTDNITAANFDASTNLDSASKEGQSDTSRWTPKAAGQIESYLVGGLTPSSTYYFAVKTDDERPNPSAISNVISTSAANVIGSNVRINEICPLGASAGDDWIEFYCARGTATTDTVNINGWQILGIKAGDTSESTLKTLPNITLTKGDYLVLNCSAGTDETDASGKGANGYWDVYAALDLRGFEGVVTLKDSVGNIVDFVAYSQGTAPSWNTIWNNAYNWSQWSPNTYAVADAADWSAGFSTTTLARDGFSTDTDNTGAAKNDWHVFRTTSTKGCANDDLPPCGISNLTALSGSDGVFLLWTSPGDDGTVGNLTGTFRVNRSSVGIVTAANFRDTTSTFATVVDISTASLPPLTVCSQFITGFTLSDNNKPFWFAIKAADDIGNWSVWNSSADAPFTQNTSAHAVIRIEAPNQISDLSALTGTNDGEVVLKWTAPGDDGTVGNISGGAYWVKYSTNPIGNETVFTNAAPFTVKSTNTVTQQSLSATVTGLNPGTSYYFAVKFRDEVTDNWAAWSTGTYTNTASSAAAQDLPPSAPSGLTRTAANARITLSWNAVSAFDLDKYNIYRDSWNAGSSYVFLASTPSGFTSFTDTGLRNNNTYYYRLSAVDKGDQGNGLYSIALESGYSLFIPTAPFIMPPVLVSADYSGSSINLVWTHSPDFTASNFSSYRIYYSTVSGGPYTLAGSTPAGTAYSDPIVSPRVQTIYYYVMTSRDSDGVESAYSNEKMANPDTIPPTVVHSLVTEIDVLGGYAIFVATITDVDNTGAKGTVVSAKLYYSTGTSNFWHEVSTNSAVGDLYTFKIGPIDAAFLVDFKYYIEAKDVASNNGYVVIDGDTKTATNAPTVDVKTQTAVITLTSVGGTISVSDGDQTDGETSVTIPAGALAANLPITILQKGYTGDTTPPPVAFKNENTATIAANSTGPVVCFDFTPDNTHFKKPVVLTIRYLDQNNDGEIDDRPGIFETALRIYYWDNWEWRYLGGTVDTVKNTVSVNVDHFTLFALFPKGAIPVKPTAREKFVTPATVDGKNDRIQFECETAIKKIEIYDVTGKLLRTIDNGSDNWDGTDDDGHVLESGVYIYKVEAISGQKRTGAVVLAK